MSITLVISYLMQSFKSFLKVLLRMVLCFYKSLSSHYLTFFLTILLQYINIAWCTSSNNQLPHIHLSMLRTLLCWCQNLITNFKKANARLIIKNCQLHIAFISLAGLAWAYVQCKRLVYFIDLSLKHTILVKVCDLCLIKSSQHAKTNII